MNTTHTDTIPLNKLASWSGNVRKTGADTNLAELSASIAAHGLLQSLVVRKDKKGKYAVVAGRRRLMALTALAQRGAIAKDLPVPCQIIADDANATEISLVENSVREQMHPADEFDAFLVLIESGMNAADVAARFGVTETVVQQRLKLARVSPAIIAAYRKGAIGLGHVMAFAVADDHAAQERVWDELSDWQLDDPDNIRAALTEHGINAADRRVKFVTLKAYEKAGGAVRRDLFAQGEDGVFIEDAVLLESLVAKKLEKAAASVRKEGWKWVEIRSAFDYSEWSKCERRYPEAPELSAADQAELDALNSEYEALSEEDSDSDEENPRLDEITARIEEIDDRQKSWTPETLAMAGAVVSIGHDGKADINYGYVKAEDAPKKTKKPKSGANGADADDEGGGMSAVLIESLTGCRTAALGAALMGDTSTALAAVVHVMVLPLFYNGHSRDTCLRINVAETVLKDVEGATACAALAQAKEQWGERLPGDPAELWPWCIRQTQETLLEILACCAALTVDAVSTKSGRAGDERPIHADQLAASLQLDMAAWFKPTAANYFSRIGKVAILAALQEGKGATAPAWAKAKKSELALIAERELAGSGWLPALLRRVE